MGPELPKASLISVLLLMVLVTGCVWSFFHRAREARRLATEAEMLAACQRAAHGIQRLRLQKQRALLKTKPSDELNRKVDAWARDAQIDTTLVARIEPQEPRRVGDSQYLEQVTELELLGVPLDRLIRLAQLAESGDESLKMTALRLSPPRTAAPTEGGPETWNAEVALTYLIYAPKSVAR